LGVGFFVGEGEGLVFWGGGGVVRLGFFLVCFCPFLGVGWSLLGGGGGGLVLACVLGVVFLVGGGGGAGEESVLVGTSPPFGWEKGGHHCTIPGGEKGLTSCGNTRNETPKRLLRAAPQGPRKDSAKGNKLLWQESFEEMPQSLPRGGRL